MTKYASSDRFGGDCIKRLELEGAMKHNHCIGMGHTRWATHGDKTDVNAHPHFDYKKRVSIENKTMKFDRLQNYKMLNSFLLESLS